MKLYYAIPILLLAAFTLEAQIIHIPSDQPNIQAGIDVANDGDTILVAEGTYFENINFLGKPVTVASEFILDGDTSHISKTIIDGSQSMKPDTASTVLMVSGEDTTTVLMGFTIQGGGGTNWVPRLDGIKRRSGGGIYMVKSGGLIYRNIIKHNHLEDPTVRAFFGGGVFVWLELDHTAILRGNWIHHNTITASVYAANGGGLGLIGGRVICEDNEISFNALTSPYMANGAGIFWELSGSMETIEEVIIRNNIIYENSMNHDNSAGGGGGYSQWGGSENSHIQVYNNVFSNNITSSTGGAIYTRNTVGSFFNNTIVDNMQDEDMHSVALLLPGEGGIILFNNIISSSSDITYPDIGFYGGNKVYVFNNMLNMPFRIGDPVIARGNMYLEPEFIPGSFEMSENSLAIGRGIDSVQVGSVWYKAPSYDIVGNPRPGGVDQFVDIGAFESEYERPLLANADLYSLGMVGHSTAPPFHKDTLNYLLVKDPGNTVIGNWRIYTADNLATLEIDTAADLLSENELDRTTKILVTAMDGITQKEYTVVYKYLSDDASLASLDVSLGTLNPSFDPSVTAYYDTIPYGLKLPTPEVTCIASDTSATVVVQPAQDIYNQFEVFRKTTITVTSPNDVTQKTYTILFTVDMTQPELILLQDSVELGKEIGVVVYEPGQVYLVPENTPGVHDSIVAGHLLLAEAENSDTLFLSTEGLESGNYWLYTCGEHQSLSEHQTVTTILVEGITGTQADHFRVYPTLVTHTLYIETSFPVKSVELYNVLGTSVLKVANPDGKIDVNHLPEGIYVLRTVFENRDVVTNRIIKY